MKTLQLTSLKKIFAHPARMAIAATLALLAARGLGLPQVYWAPIAALIVVQSEFNAMMATSWLLLVGTALGACAGALLANYVGTGVLVFAGGILCIGLLSAILRLDRRANHFAAIALLIVLLVGPVNEAWARALGRFIEFSTGITIGLLVSALWPEKQTGQAGAVVKSIQETKQTNSVKKYDSK
jgi:uncharacterized membrane protein YgaE (UPF0421/DUF939 family)